MKDNHDYLETVQQVIMTVFPNRPVTGPCLGEIARKTTAWRAGASSHLVHFNNARFLRPHPTEG